MLFNILKFFHILFAITAFGANITYGVWQARGALDPELLILAILFLMVTKPSL